MFQCECVVSTCKYSERQGKNMALLKSRFTTLQLASMVEVLNTCYSKCMMSDEIDIFKLMRRSRCIQKRHKYKPWDLVFNRLSYFSIYFIDFLFTDSI